MAYSDGDIGKRSQTVTLSNVLLLVGGLADFFLAAEAVVISEAVTLFLLGTGLIMIGQFGKRFIK